MLKQWWLRVVVLLVVVISILPALPVAAQSSCTISTRATVRMRSGHSTNDAVVGNMPRNKQLQAVERFVEPLGGNKTRVWYRLVKEEVTLTAETEQVWVGGTVKTKGDCVNIASAAPAEAAPVTDAGSAPASASTSGVTLPQEGTWAWSAGDTVYATCPNIGSASIPYSEIYAGLPNQFDVIVTHTANGFIADGVEFTRGGDGTWYGFVVDVNSPATFRVDSPTTLLGDLVVNTSDGCTLKVALWGNPR